MMFIKYAAVQLGLKKQLEPPVKEDKAKRIVAKRMQTPPAPQGVLRMTVVRARNLIKADKVNSPPLPLTTPPNIFLTFCS
jgi:hypothetical protein